MRQQGFDRAGRNALQRFGGLIAVVICAAVVALMVPGGVQAGLHNPISADESGDPTDTFNDTDSIWAYATSDITGGYICVVGPNAVSGGGCGGGTHLHREISIGTTFVLVASQLGAGTYRLMATDQNDENGQVSEPFTVVPCTDCQANFDDQILADWKLQAHNMAEGMDLTCLGLKEKSLIGNGFNARGLVKDVLDRYHDYASQSTGFLAQVEPIIGGALGFVFDPPGFDNPGEEKAMEILTDLTCGLTEMYADDEADPPDPDFTTVSQPQFSQLPSDQTPSDTALMSAVDRQSAYGEAALAAYQRYQGAVAAGNLAYAHAQAAAAAQYGNGLVGELTKTIAALRAEASALAALPEFAAPVIATDKDRSDLAALFARVRTNGFSADETAQLTAIGFTGAEIGEIRSHFNDDPLLLPVGETVQEQLNATATTLEAGVGAFQDFADDASVVAGRANVPPSASFTASPTAGLSPLSVTFTDTSTSPDLDPLQVSWDFGDGTIGEGPTANHTFMLPGSYQVTESVSDSLTTVTTAQIVHVRAPGVDSPPVAVDDAATSRGAATVIDVLANDHDPDFDHLLITSYTQGAHGSVACSDSCTYTPAAEFFGTDSFTYTVDDGFGSTATGTVTVDVTDVTAAVDASVTAGFSPLTVRFDGSRSSAAHGSITSYSWDFGDGSTATGPQPSHIFTGSGAYVVTLTVTDSSGAFDVASQRIDVNDLASLTDLPVCGDQDGSELPFILGSGCTGYTATLDTQMYRVGGSGKVDLGFDWVYRQASFNNELCVFSVDDDSGAIGNLHPGDQGYIQAAVSRAQVVFPSGSDASVPDVTLQFQGGDRLVFFIVVDDTLQHLKSDNPNDLPRTPEAFFSLGSLNPDKQVHMVAFAHDTNDHQQFGWEDLNPAGGDFNDIVFDVSGPVTSLPFLSTSKTADEKSATSGAEDGYTITLTNSDSAPHTAGSIVDTLPDGFSYRAGTTTGATSANPTIGGHVLTWTGPFTVPAQGSITLHFGVTVATAAGSYFNNATATSTDAVAGSGPTAEIDVSGALNHPPVAADQSVSTNQETALQVTLGASDSDGDVLTFAVGVGPAHGSLGAVSGNKVTYTPAAGYSGPDSFTFRANDGTVNSNTATVSITVNKVNHAPVASDQSVSTNQETALQVTLGASDSDGDVLTFAVGVGPAHGSLGAVSGNKVTYTPAAGYSGPDSFTFRANDGTVNSNTATVSVTVNKVNHAPVASDQSVSTNQETALQVTLGASDSDGDVLTFEVGVGPAHGSLGAVSGNKVTYTPAAGYSGPDSFTFRANDGTVNSNTATVSITVVPPSPTSLTVNASSGDYADATVVSAVLRNRTTAAPVQGEPVQLILNGKEACRGTTDSTGTASCSLTPLEAAGPYALSGSFAGDTGRSPALLASSGSNTFTVTPEEAALAYTGPTSAVNGQPFTLAAQLTTDDPVLSQGLGTRSVLLTLGAGLTAQSCSGTTSATGGVSCLIGSVSQTPGLVPIAASFAGDSFYRPATAAASVNVFAPPATGAFVVGDRSAGYLKPEKSVTFWGSQWTKDNVLSGGGAPSAFKGFADSPTSITCGARWTTRPGNSALPPPTLPSRIQVLVTDRVQKSGSVITGTILHIVVIQVDKGYGPEPGHTGTGKIVATIC